MCRGLINNVDVEDLVELTFPLKVKILFKNVWISFCNFNYDCPHVLSNACLFSRNIYYMLGWLTVGGTL